jgi:hypothetical protein
VISSLDSVAAAAAGAAGAAGPGAVDETQLNRAVSAVAKVYLP